METVKPFRVVTENYILLDGVLSVDLATNRAIYTGNTHTLPDSLFKLQRNSGVQDIQGKYVFEGDYCQAEYDGGIFCFEVKFYEGCFGYDSNECKTILNPSKWEKTYNYTSSGWFCHYNEGKPYFFPLMGIGYSKVKPNTLKIITKEEFENAIH